MRCPSCGATVESVSQRFCQTCGAPLDQQQLRQQLQQQEQGAAGSFSSPSNPQIAQGARSSLDSLGNQVNQALVTRNTGQLIVYAGIAIVVVLVATAIVHALMAALPFIVIIALIAYMRRNRGSRRW